MVHRVPFERRPIKRDINHSARENHIILMHRYIYARSCQRYTNYTSRYMSMHVTHMRKQKYTRRNTRSYVVWLIYTFVRGLFKICSR
ncbi:hypothetical protein PUN28_002701 [Cardiocondyla obscurior]|uniref:Uncharacterized protein n=1 Tax=Cardiocondyla obscurior TaxID=286306 RepID=A0AAW2GVP3_9HYME